MEGRAAFLRVGLLIFGGLGLLIGLVVFLAGNRLRQGTPFETYFHESVQGLDVGAPVKFLGVTLGRVTAIGLTSAEYGQGLPADVRRESYRQVYVRFIIDANRVGRLPDTETSIRTGLRAKVASQGLTGLSYIELAFTNPVDYPPEEVPWTPKYEFIPSAPSTLTQVSEAGQQFLAKLNRVDIDKVAENLDGLLTDLRGELKDGDIHQAMAELHDTLEDLRAQVKQADLPGLVADLRATSDSARGLLASREMRDVLLNANAALQRFTVAAGKLDVLIAAVQATASRASNGTTDVVAALSPLLRDLSAVMNNLRETTGDLRRYPAGALLGGPPPRDVPAR